MYTLPTDQLLAAAVAGMVGLISTVIVIYYAFSRNHTGDGKYD